MTQQQGGVPESDPQLTQIHPETNRAAQQVSHFSSTITTPFNLDSTQSYGVLCGEPDLATFFQLSP